MLRKYTKYTSRFLVLTCFISLGLGAASGSGPGTGFFRSGIDVVPPDTASGKDTTLLFPLPETANPYETSAPQKLYLKDPSNITRDVEYNPATNEYTVTSKIGNFNYNNPASLTFDEYKNWDLRRSVDKYWLERSQSNTGAARQGVIPQLRIGGELFDKVFGGNTIDIRPQGSAELIFGAISNRREDPAIDQRLRRTTNFNFEEKIQMSVMAKIGDKIEFNTNYNTEATFDFENKLKLKYEGKEDEIIKLIEAGDVNLPLNSTLITGSQSLFGLKTQMQFGKATVTTVFSQQQSQVENISVQGGAQTSKFSLRSLDYEENKHFFLAQYFRDNYDKALESLPVITSNVNITKIEVWVTNIGAAVTENRNIVAFQDLGEIKPYNQAVLPATMVPYPGNNVNSLLYEMDEEQLRNIIRVNDYLTIQKGFVPGTDFEKIESARKLNATEYSFNSRLGFISLNTSLNPDQTLAVAYQYTVIGSDSVYQVGEFSDQGVGTTNCLFVKLLKSTAVNTRIPLWNLMMKNVYNIGAFNVNREDFMLNILYSGNSNAVPTGYFTDGPEGVKGMPLIQLLGFDRLDPQQNPPADGIFDFLDNAARNGGTINSANGRVFFTVLEPFGSYLRSKIPDKTTADKYCYDSLYTMTKTGAQQFPEKNKFLIEGLYKSESGSDISLNAMNVPQGSVRVTAGGIPLVENVDFTVDYTLGRVKIINEGILNSGTPINISLENNSLFNVYSQSLLGTHVDYKVNKDLLLGGTIMNLYERPITQKTNYGDEPISNTIWGMSFNYNRESAFITKLIDKLPFISTKVPSKVRFDGEFAHFIPGHSKAVGKTGTSYIDDFEGAKSTISLNTIGTWFLASTPQGQTTRNMFPEAAPGTGIAYGYNRAKLAWYNIDATIFYDKGSNRRPENISKDELSKNSTRVVYETELFPNIDPPNGQPLNIPMFNVAYFPEERGPYNFDVDGSSFSYGLTEQGTLKNANTRWGGIMRKIETSDFEAANVEYITFWLMDPFSEDAENQGGELYFNLGDISEDILRDGRKAYENGLPTSEQVLNVDTTIWGRVPTLQAITESFDSKPEARPFQDIGYDGLSDADEKGFFYTRFLEKIANRYGLGSDAYVKAEADPSGDDYHHFTGDDYDGDITYTSVVNRYKNYNGTEGNSPSGNAQTIATQLPNVEDINRDNTLSDQERYFQYVIHLRPERMNIGENYITDMYHAKDIPLENGKRGDVKWYQFKIPIQMPDNVVGNIQDFKSIRFIRMFMKNFSNPVVCRFATLELERGEWRKYYNSLLAPGEYIPDPNQNATSFDLSTVSIEENGSRYPVPYVLPPGIEREVNVATTNYQQLNEQSMVLKTCNLMDGDARGAFKTTDFDFRDYKNLKMYIHAEKTIPEQELMKGDLSAFIRIGSDFTGNYYEYEIPLTFTPWGTSAGDPNGIWPAANIMDMELDKLINAKRLRNEALNRPGNALTINMPFTVADGENKITIVGMPSLSDVRAFMVGIRNPKRNPNNPGTDDGQSKCAEVWMNELRLTNFNEKSGWASNARFATNLADLGTMVLSGAYSSPGFGSIEKKVTERQKEAISQFDFATNLELGKFLPEKTGIRIPMHYDYSQTVSNPQYNPLDPDVEYSELMNELDKSGRDSLRSRTTDITRRQNLNFMNVRKDKVGAKGKPQLWDIENFDLSYAYSEISRSNVDIESAKQKTYKGGLGYNFAVNPKNIRPFQKIIKAKSLSLLRDFNFYYLPKMLSFRTDMLRDYESRLLRNKSQALIILTPTYTKRWDWNRIYDLRFDITQSLKLDYNANVNAYIHEPPGGFEKGLDTYQAYKDSVMNSIMDFGSMNRFNQSANLNYSVPFSKIPLLNFMNASARYGIMYRWEASPRSLQSKFGNTIENSQNIQVNGSLRMSTLYNKVGFLKKVSQELQSQGAKPPAKGKPEEKGKTGDKKGGKDAKEDEAQAGKQANLAAEADTAEKPKKNYLKIIGYNLVGVLMSLKDANLSYNEMNGITIPGFMPEPGVIGNNWKSDAPGMGFILGSQNDIRYLARDKGWLSSDTLMNNPSIFRKTKALTFRSTLEPVRSLKIEINADRNYSSTYQDYYKADRNGEFRPTSPQERGSFSMSYIIWPTAFRKDNDEDVSPVFEQMLTNRFAIAEQLAARNPNSIGYNDSTGFPNGYGPTQPEVLLGAFMSAYTGRDPGKTNLTAFPKFPLPNWRITYNATQGIKFIKNNFQSFNISHAYRSSYSIGGYQSDINYKEDGGFASALDNAENIIPYNRLEQVSITEQFGPFLGIDLTMKNSLMARVEYKKTRNLSLSFVNNQLTEMRSNELVIGTGYRFKSVRINITSMNTGKKKPLKSDLNVKFDFSIRDNKTILRRIEERNNQISTGARQISINTSADYMVSQKLNVRLFFEKTISDPHVSTQILTSTTNAGVSLRFTLAQ